MLHALRAAGITQTMPDKPAGAYPWTPPTLVVFALKTRRRGADREPELLLAPEGLTARVACGT